MPWQVWFGLKHPLFVQVPVAVGLLLAFALLAILASRRFRPLD